jgi:hypothetical protein
VLFIIRYYIGDIINNSLVLIAMVSIALKLAGKLNGFNLMSGVSLFNAKDLYKRLFSPFSTA